MIKFISGDVWSKLRSAAKDSTRRAHVAVAYFGKDSAKLLPLPKGSRLVVDASAAAVKAGQTHPADLKQLIAKRNVSVYSVSNLHAKVFVIGSTVYIGSANVSNSSADSLIEALVSTTDPQIVKAAREFVGDLCLQNLGPEELDRLQDIYRPPRFSGVKIVRNSNGSRRPVLSRLKIAQLERGHLPKEGKEAESVGEQAARKRMENQRQHLLDNFYWSGKNSFKLGDNVLQVTKEVDGRRLVDPPARVIHIHTWVTSGTTYTFVYVERPFGNRVGLGKLANRLGTGGRKLLVRNGAVSRQNAQRILTAWSR